MAEQWLMTEIKTDPKYNTLPTLQGAGLE